MKTNQENEFVTNPVNNVKKQFFKNLFKYLQKKQYNEKNKYIPRNYPGHFSFYLCGNVKMNLIYT